MFFTVSDIMNGNRNDDAATGDRGEAAKKVMGEMTVVMLLV